MSSKRSRGGRAVKRPEAFYKRKCLVDPASLFKIYDVPSPIAKASRAKTGSKVEYTATLHSGVTVKYAAVKTGSVWWLQTNTETGTSRNLFVESVTMHPHHDLSTMSSTFVPAIASAEAKRAWASAKCGKRVPPALAAVWRFGYMLSAQVIRVRKAFPVCTERSRWMFHGTSAKNAVSIFAGGFDRDQSRPGCAFGQGLYVTNNPRIAYRHGTDIVVFVVDAGKVVPKAHREGDTAQAARPLEMRHGDRRHCVLYNYLGSKALCVKSKIAQYATPCMIFRF